MLNSKPRRIAVTAHPKVPDAHPESRLIGDFLSNLGIDITIGLLDDSEVQRQIIDGKFDLLIALGGDGTMLRAGHLCGPINLPILGINMGRFGFLSELRQDQWKERIPDLLEGNFRIERRMMLCAEQWRGEERLGSWDVLNEVAISRGQFVRPIHLSAFVDGRFLTTYVADALIAATPTGSTAYALAAGGPILPPELRNILLVAVAPHLSIDRAIILAEGSSVSISAQTDHEAVFSVDGQSPILLTNEDRVIANASEHTVQFIRFQDPGYFYRNLTQHMNQNPSTGNRR
jgi:NAD+ kinase